MKPTIKFLIRNTALVIVSLMLLRFQEADDTLKNLGKGIIYLKENRIIKNIKLREIKSIYIVYEKEGNLHDRTMEEIKWIEFPDAKPEAVKMIFENNKPVVKKIYSDN